MAKEEPTRLVVKRLKDAGFVLVSTKGPHDKYRHPSGISVPLKKNPTQSAGVVRQVDQRIKEAQL